MKKNIDWQIILALALILLSALFYIITYEVFHNGEYIVMSILTNIAFSFFEVLLVSIIIHRLLSDREKKVLLNKLNMVIGTFFIEVGTELIHRCVSLDKKSYEISSELIVTDKWSNRDFYHVSSIIKKHQSDFEYINGEMESLKIFLFSKRSFLLGLLENQNLLEHDSFSNLLWAVFHLTDELSHREDMRKLTIMDQKHLCKDVERAYNLIIMEWLMYMKHLKTDYPYLFSLAMRTNPFDSKASVELK